MYSIFREEKNDFTSHLIQLGAISVVLEAYIIISFLLTTARYKQWRADRGFLMPGATHVSPAPVPLPPLRPLFGPCSKAVTLTSLLDWISP